MLGSGIPDKGRVLNQLSAFWFARTGGIIREPPDLDRRRRLSGRARGRSRPSSTAARCWRAAPRRSRSNASRAATSRDRAGRTTRRPARCAAFALPKGLRESDRLPEPIFTPATKAESGHDENISEAAAAKVVGADLLARLKQLTLELYAHGVAHAESKGIILADTKFEFGLTDAGELLLIDEMMTPDSSRYWPKDTYSPGGPQPSFDKQYVRDYLESIKWNKQPPVPSLPDDVVENTRAKYLDAFRRLTGRELDDVAACDKRAWLSNSSSTQMVEKGIHYEDALREFDRRFIAKWSTRATATSARRPTRSGVHRNTLARKIKELKIRARI